MPDRLISGAARIWLEGRRASGRFVDLKPVWRHRTDRLTAKSWILPDGQAMSIARWHYEWILEHRDLAKHYGVELQGNLQEEQPVRIAAVKAGFFRVNYEIRTGLLTVEGLKSRFWRLSREAVGVIVLESIDQIGSLVITLFDDAVHRVTTAQRLDLARLGSLEEKVEAVEAFLGILIHS